MRWAQVRGLLAFAAVVFAITYAWTTIENREADVAGPVGTTTTAPPISTTAHPTTTTTPRQALLQMCERSSLFVEESALIPDDDGPGSLARLALEFWTDIGEVATSEVAIEVVAIIDYYEDYLETAEPFDFDTVKIILEGDKEKFEQLVTRPAPGLAQVRDLLEFLCGVEVPDQPRISAKGFDDLEDRLLDPPDP